MSMEKLKTTLCETESRLAKTSAKVREKLTDTGSDLTLERAIEVARVDDDSVQQLKEMTDETEQGVHAVKKKN